MHKKLRHNIFKFLFDVRIIRFFFVGILNSAFGFSVFALIAYLGGHTWQALLGGNLAGIVFNFFTIGGVVFRDLAIRRAPRFLFAYAVLFTINLKFIELLMYYALLDRITAQAFLTAPLAIVSYFVMKKFVFFGRVC